MSALGDWYSLIRRQKRKVLESVRMEYALTKLEEIQCHSLHVRHKKKCIEFSLDERSGTIFPYTGWWAGNKGIKSGRGIHKLITRLKKLQQQDENARNNKR